ncbi:MAG: ABC transporter permease [Actinomycetota bacterium]
MGVLADTVSWFSDSANWSGTFGVPNRVLEHVQMSVLTTGLAMLAALPVGLYIGHAKRFEFLAVSIGNIGRALPSFGVLALVFPFTLDLPGELGFWPIVIALFLLGIPPILLNTYAGVKAVDPDTVEAARGMGMTGTEVLRKVELPLAAPLIVAGIRIAAVQIVATATLWALVAGGGLGRYIIDGFSARDDPQILAGAILVAVLAILTELCLGLVERFVTSGRKESKRTLSRQFEDMPPPPVVIA